MTTFWHDDQFRYDGQRPSWEDAMPEPSHERYWPMRGYVPNVQAHIDDDGFDAVRGGEVPWRG